MDELISRRAIRDHVYAVYRTAHQNGFEVSESLILACIDNAPTIDPVRHARWVCDKGVSACSDCGGEQKYNDWDELEFTPWCHGCGARMDAEEENNGYHR